MNKMLTKICNAATRFYESLIPDEETARKISEKYTKMYHVSHFDK